MAEGDVTIKLGADAQELNQAVQQSATTVRDLRKELGELKNAAIGLSTTGEEYRKLESRAKDVQKQLDSLRRLGKDNHDVFQRLGQTMAVYAAGVLSAGLALGKLQQFVEEAIKSNESMARKLKDVEEAGKSVQRSIGFLIDEVDEATGFTRDLNTILTATATLFNEASFEGRAFAETLKAIATGGIGAVISGAAGVMRLTAGLNTQPGAGNARAGILGMFTGGTTTAPLPFDKAGEEQLKSTLKDIVRQFKDLRKEADKAATSIDRVIPRRRIPLQAGMIALPEEPIPSFFRPGDFGDTRTREALQNTLRRSNLVRRRREMEAAAFNETLLSGAHNFVSIMSGGLIQLGNTFEGRLIRAAAAFVATMLSAQPGPVGLLGTLFGSIFSGGGGDFVTHGPTVLFLGDNPGGVERVHVEPVSGRGQTRVYGNAVRMGGGGTITSMPNSQQNITAVANVDVYLGNRRLVKNIDYGIRSRAKALNDRRGVPS